MINITVIDINGKSERLKIPTDINLNLMEVLKGYGYDIMATCGGMALCATCLIQVLEGLDKISDAKDAELDMLDTLPEWNENFRLSCQIRIAEELDGLKILIKQAAV